MILLHRWKFFSNKGNELNLEKIPKIIVEIKNTLGNNANLLPITNNFGDLVSIEILEPGIGFNTGGQTNLDIIDVNGNTYNVPFTDLTFDSNGGFLSIDITNAPAGEFSYPSFTYEGNLFIDKISAGLIENEHVFIIEEISDTITGKSGYVFPRFSGSGGTIEWKWTEENTLAQDKEAFFIFNVDTISDTIPFIEKREQVNFDLANGQFDSILTTPKYIRNIPDTDNNSIQLNLGLSYPSEGIFERKIELWDKSSIEPKLLVELYLRGEVIPEDERFITILENLGQNINREEEFIFRNSDINEDLPDFDLLNQKRKEFILEYSSIIPYIGSYKAIFNVLNWLGYNDLKLKEYWLNVEENSNNFNKYKPIEIPFDAKRRNKNLLNNEILPSNIYKKTNLFALYYDINRTSGEIDVFGIPETVDAFMFTNEEVLIKLFALKNYLKRKFLPLNARIIDIVGEGIYFERYRINSWKDGTKIFNVIPIRNADFECFPKNPTIVDLRQLGNFEYFKPAKLKTFLNQNKQAVAIIEDPGFGYVGDVSVVFVGGIPIDANNLPVYTANVVNGSIASLSVVNPGTAFVSTPIAFISPDSTNPDRNSTIINLIKNRVLFSFQGFKANNLADRSNLPIGAPVILKSSSFDITWDELQFTWDSFYYTNWNEIGIGIFYEIEWKVYGPKGFFYEVRGKVADLEEHGIIAPYIGDYDVELILHNTDNNITNEIKRKCFRVNTPEINFTAFGQYTKGLTVWNEMDLSWNQALFPWINPIIHETTWNDLDLSWDSFDMNSYVDQLEKRFPAKIPTKVLRISETDRFLGNLIGINKNSQTLEIKDATNRPEIQLGEYIYLRRDDTIFRTQVISKNYGYTVQKIDLINSGTGYAIEYNFLTNTENFGRPDVVLETSPTGNNCQAIAILNCTVSEINLVFQGQDFRYVIDSTNNFVPAIPVSTSPGFEVYNFTTVNPLDPLGVIAFGTIQVETVGGGVVSVTILDGGSGYNVVPDLIITDANGDKVVSLINSDPKFSVRIEGGIGKINIVNPGSGYSTNPIVTIDPPFLPGILATANSVLNTQTNITTLGVSSLPLGITNNWDALREIGQTILLENNVIQNELNVLGLQNGDWLTLRGKDNIPQLPNLAIQNSVLNSFDDIIGIELNGNYTQQFKIGEKCKIYKKRTLLLGNSLNSDEFYVDTATNQIIIYNPSFNPLDEIIPGYHIITVTNVDNTQVTDLDVYTQRFLVEHVYIDNNDCFLQIIPIDGDISQIQSFNLPSSTRLEYKYWDFTGVIVSTNYTGSTTEVILNFNDWPENLNFTGNVNSWFFDYGIVSGEWSMQIIDVGLEGQNTLVTVDDPNSELWRSSATFIADWRVFDEDYAENRMGTQVLKWNNFDEIIWDDMKSFTWDMFDYNPYSYTGFKIFDTQPSGRIQWNEDPVFEFQGITGTMNTIQKLQQAVIELNSTDNSGMNRFRYTLLPDETTPTYIMASAKNPGGENLGYIRFTNGVIGEYLDPSLSHTFPLNNTVNPDWLSGFYGPDNKPAIWNSLIRAYREWGIDPAGNIGWYPANRLPKVYDSIQRKWESERIPYLRALAGSLTWQEIFSSPQNVQVPIYTLVFLRADNCKIAGKTQYLWKVINSKTQKVLVESIKPYLIWLFSENGEFDIELTITDTNRNIITRKRKGFIKTYQPSLIENRIATPA